MGAVAITRREKTKKAQETYEKKVIHEEAPHRYTIAAEDLTAAIAGFTAIQNSLTGSLQILQDAERKRVQHLGTRNETFSMAAIEVARQHPEVVPAGIEMAALERDIKARQQLLPLLLRARQIVRMLEDTVAMLGVDIYNGARGVYRSAQIVGELHGLADVVEQLAQHFARNPNVEVEPGLASATPGTMI